MAFGACLALPLGRAASAPVGPSAAVPCASFEFSLTLSITLMSFSLIFYTSKIFEVHFGGTS